jgi:hypothetical protein
MLWSQSPFFIRPVYGWTVQSRPFILATFPCTLQRGCCQTLDKRGYPRTNYPHAAVLPRDGAQDTFAFKNWRLDVRNGLFLPIPAESELPERYQSLPPEYTTSRIFRWAVCFFASRL